MKQLGYLTSHLQPVLTRSLLTKARNRTTIPALLFIQNVSIQTKYERQMPKLFHARSLGIIFFRQDCFQYHSRLLHPNIKPTPLFLHRKQKE